MASGDENSSVSPETPAPVQLPAVIAPAETSTRVIGPKLAATLVLTGAVVVAVAMPMLTLKIPSHSNSFAARPTPAPVRIVSAPQRAAIPCAQQTWPYIEAHCLKQGGDKIMPVPIASAPESTGTANSMTAGEAAKENAAKATKPNDGAEKKQTAALAPATPVEPGRDAEESELRPSAPILARVPLPQPRPVAADDSDEEFTQPEPRRQARPRRYYYEEPRNRLVRELNRVIPFGILRF